MTLEFYQHLPSIISPIAFSIGSFHVRWYSLSYVVGFLVAYLVMFRSLRISEINKDFQISNLVIDFLLVNFFAALIGGRIGYVIFYDQIFFKAHPSYIFSPFQNGNLIGFYGMSYYGALVAIILASFVFTKIKKIDFWLWADKVAPAAAAGYFFGRIGNFLNGELYGRITDSKLGMYFLNDQTHLRHPSQIYEAIGEGLILFILLWNLKKFNLPKGFVFGSYLVGYALIRFFLEFFREPDPQLGYIWLNLTMGQFFSIITLIIGILLLFKIKGNKTKS